jgi:hypothetical protein
MMGLIAITFAKRSIAIRIKTICLAITLAYIYYAPRRNKLIGRLDNLEI